MNGRQSYGAWDRNVQRLLQEIRAKYEAEERALHPQAYVNDGTCSWCLERATAHTRHAGYCSDHFIAVTSKGSEMDRR